MIRIILFTTIVYGAVVAIIFSILQTMFPDDLIFPETREANAMVALTTGLLLIFIIIALLKLLSIY